VEALKYITAPVFTGFVVATRMGSFILYIISANMSLTQRWWENIPLQLIQAIALPISKIEDYSLLERENFVSRQVNLLITVQHLYYKTYDL
jgi:hypothetical protein